MTVDELKTLYGVFRDCHLADKLKITKGTISKWRRNGVPVDWQLSIQDASKNRLKADKTKLPYAPTP